MFGAAGREVLTIARRFGAVEIDHGTAGIVKGRLVLFAQNRPRLHFRLVGQHADAAPDEIDPGRVRLAAFDHDADGNTQQGYSGRAQLAASRCLIGNPVNRFCGFIRKLWSDVIARIKYTGSCSTDVSHQGSVGKVEAKQRQHAARGPVVQSFTMPEPVANPGGLGIESRRTR